LKANKVNLFVSSVLFVFWYHSPNVLDTLHICNISWLRVKSREGFSSVTTISGIKEFLKIYEQPQKSRCQKYDKEQFPHKGPTDVRRHRTTNRSGIVHPCILYIYIYIYIYTHRVSGLEVYKNTCLCFSN
jgi:hypothetical protein